MMNILLPVFLSFLLAEEDYFLEVILSFFITSLLVEFYCVSPYSGLTPLYVDGVSIVLILLTVWISGLIMVVSGNTCDFCGLDALYGVICSLCLSLILAFIAGNLFFFYFFFEFSLVPITMMVLGWGYQPERLTATAYLFIYTVTCSLPLLSVIFILYGYKGHVDFNLYYWGNLWNLGGDIMVFVMSLAFLANTPVYFFHLWLPKAHVESPLVGSMVLAGVLLKLGGYGFIRMFFIFQPQGYLGYGGGLSFVFSSIAVWGGVICGFICLRQVDIKCLIAYSSVTHMGVIVGGLLSCSYLGSCGAVVVMLSHGLVSSSMFLGAFIMYKIFSTRSLYLIKGVLGVCPLVSMVWFLSLSANMGAPPTLNLFGEVILVGGMVKMSVWLVPSLFMSLFLSAAYSLFLYVITQNGSVSVGVSGFFSVLTSDSVSMFLHLFPAYVLLLASPNMFYGLGF